MTTWTEFYAWLIARRFRLAHRRATERRYRDSYQRWRDDSNDPDWVSKITAKLHEGNQLELDDIKTPTELDLEAIAPHDQTPTPPHGTRYHQPRHARPSLEEAS